MAEDKGQIKGLAKKNIEYLQKVAGLPKGFTGNVRLDMRVTDGGVCHVVYVVEVNCN